MSLPTAIPLPEDKIAEVCRRHGVRELAVFGSVLTDDFRPDSDVDFLVTFENPQNLGPWMSRLTNLQEELGKVTGRKADVALRDGLKWVIRDRVLASARVIYANG